MMTTALLSSAYFAPVQWYQKLCRYDRVLIEHHDSYAKQTYRNRCLIAGANGVQALTVPVSHSCRISDHGNWRHQHWQAITSVYDFNEAIRQKMCELLDIQPRVDFTTCYVKEEERAAWQPPADDFREAINPKHPWPDADFRPRPYYQVFSGKHGFLPNLSILDLLMNMGPESIFFLIRNQ